MLVMTLMLLLMLAFLVKSMFDVDANFGGDVDVAIDFSCCADVCVRVDFDINFGVDVDVVVDVDDEC